MEDAPFFSISKGVLREAEGESNDRVTCERRNIQKNDMSFSRAPIHAPISRNGYFGNMGNLLS